MTEGADGRFTRFETGYDPGEPVDQAIVARRNAVFPLHGLMPWPGGHNLVRCHGSISSAVGRRAVT